MKTDQATGTPLPDVPADLGRLEPGRIELISKQKCSLAFRAVVIAVTFLAGVVTGMLSDGLIG